jgi:NDP-sugar pyrophosphorylase family protein
LATRLRPLTEDLPKALVDINGEPFVAHQLRLLRGQGVTRVIICAGYRGELIQEFVGNGAAFGLDVRFAFDGPQLLGTAGAVKNAWPLVGTAGFFYAIYLPATITRSRMRSIALMAGADNRVP